MADDIDAGINLNISIPTKRPSNKSSNQRDRITGDRRQRIKARKSLKRLKEKNDDANLAENVQLKNLSKTETDSGLDNTTSDKFDKQDSGNKDSNHREEGSKKKTGAVISSLFRHNPDIPTVTSKKVEQVKEKLFSSDSFQDAPLHPYMRSNLEKHGFAKMTSVQRETIPLLLNGQDVLVKSQTGSGKTLSYALPIIEDLSQQTPKLNRSDGARAIVIVPTRELAVQSYEVFEKLVKPFIWLIPGCVVGGNNRKAEKARLRKGVSVLVATPGRLMDHIENTNSLDVGKIKWLVLDEADRLLDLGFEKQIAKIIEVLDNKQTCKRQTVLLSATLSPGVERLAGMSLRDPQRVAVSNDNEAMTSSTKTTKSLTDSKTNTLDSGTDGQTDPNTDKQENFALPQSLKQYFVITPCKLRLVVLLILILSKCKRELNKKMIVFLSTQDGVEFLYKLVSYLSTEHSSDSDVDESDSEEEGERPVKTYIDVYRLHGEMSQKDRTTTFHKFCATKSGVLICTDVAARGLHLPFVQWVVQYTASSGVTDYIHRAGRTARAGTAGNSVLFLMPSEIGFIKQLNQKNISLEEWKLNEILQDVTKILPMLPGLEETQRQAPKTIEESATYLQNCCELYVKNGKDVDGLAKSAYQSYIRAYATYPTHMKPVFHVKYLHLGHVAKTFGLREAPSNIGNIAGVSVSKMQSKRKHEDDKFSHKPKKARFDPASEYKGSAMFTKKTTAKRNPNQRGKKHKTFRGKLIKKKKGK